MFLRARRQALTLFAVALVACAAPNRGQGYAVAFSEGEKAQSAGRYEEAAERYEEASRVARIGRDRDYALHAAAAMHERAGDRRTAWEELHALATADHPSDEAALAANEAAQMRIDHGEEEAGWQDLRDVLLRFPNAGVARSALHRLEWHETETKGDAGGLAFLERIRPRLEGTQCASEIDYDIALRLERLGRTVEARDAFVAVADRWPYPHGALFDDALYHASELDETLGRYDAAIADLRKMLAVRESSWLAGSYERPRYDAAKMRIADLYERRLHDDEHAARELHELYAQFTTSLLRDDALWKEAAIWEKVGAHPRACDALTTLVRDFPNSRYVPCAEGRCAGVLRPATSHAPKTCPDYVRPAPPGGAEDPMKEP